MLVTTRPRRLLAGAATIALLATGLVVPSARAAVATSVSIEIVPAAPTFADPITFRATVTPAGVCGDVDVYETTSGTPEERSGFDGICSAAGALDRVFERETYAIGHHTFEATFYPSDPGAYGTSEVAFEFDVAKAPTITTMFRDSVAEANTPIALGVDVGAYKQDSGGSVDVYRNGVVDPLCTLPITTWSTPAICMVPGLPEGTYAFHAEYSGTTQMAESVSDDLEVDVLPDEVHASGVRVEYATFYPVLDDYRDIVAIKGNRAEAISVSIKIYKPSGALLKTIQIPEGSGPYQYTWNGRTDGGTILAAGKYKVVQKLTDVGSTTESHTDYVTLSKKELVTYRKAISQSGSSVDATGSSGTGDVDLGSGFVKVHASPDTFSFAGAGWQFTIPEATVYQSVVAKVLARRSGGPGGNYLGAQNFNRCPYKAGSNWKSNCFDDLVAIPATSGTTKHTYKSSNIGGNYRAGRKMRLLVSTTGGTIWVYKVTIVVIYGVLE